MTELPVPIPPAPSLSDRDVAESVSRAVIELGLIVSMFGTLRAYPGSRHWHLRRGSSSGTLEVTWRPAERRLCVSYHANRTGEWVEELAGKLAEQIGRQLAAQERSGPSPA